MARSKKEFLTHYNDLFTVVEFHHGKRGTFSGGYPLEAAMEIVTKATKRGGFCVVYPQAQQKAVWKCIEYIEGAKGLKQGIGNGTWDTFHANIGAFLEDATNAE